MTPVMSLIFALDVQLDRILAEGLENRFARHSAMAEKTQKWMIAHGMPPLAPEGYRSRTVSTIQNAKNVDIPAFNKFLLKNGFRIANGYGQLKDKTFRIAHMGEIQMKDLDQLLAYFEEYLKS